MNTSNTPAAPAPLDISMKGSVCQYSIEDFMAKGMSWESAVTAWEFYIDYYQLSKAPETGTGSDEPLAKHPEELLTEADLPEPDDPWTDDASQVVTKAIPCAVQSPVLSLPLRGCAVFIDQSTQVTDVSAPAQDEYSQAELNALRNAIYASNGDCFWIVIKDDPAQVQQAMRYFRKYKRIDKGWNTEALTDIGDVDYKALGVQGTMRLLRVQDAEHDKKRKVERNKALEVAGYEPMLYLSNGIRCNRKTGIGDAVSKMLDNLEDFGDARAAVAAKALGYTDANLIRLPRQSINKYDKEYLDAIGTNEHPALVDLHKGNAGMTTKDFVGKKLSEIGSELNRRNKNKLRTFADIERAIRETQQAQMYAHQADAGISGKDTAIRLYNQGGLTYREIAQQLNTSKDTVYRWVKEYLASTEKVIS